MSVIVTVFLPSIHSNSNIGIDGTIENNKYDMKMTRIE